MHTEHLVSMANRIGGFFGSYVDPVEAASEIASHIQKNWAPRMRNQLLAHVDGNQGSGLQPMVLFAIETHRDRLAPTAPML
jgi:formate dehydrogenase subunit delta